MSATETAKKRIITSEINEKSFVFDSGRVHDFMFGGYLFFHNPPLPSKVKWSTPRKRTFFSRKPLEINSLAEVEFITDSCCLVSQSKYMNTSDKDWDWLILVSFFKAPLHRRFLSRQLDAIFVAPKLQPQNRTCKLGAILSAICRRDIAGVSSMFET